MPKLAEMTPCALNMSSSPQKHPINCKIRKINTSQSHGTHLIAKACQDDTRKHFQHTPEAHPLQPLRPQTSILKEQWRTHLIAKACRDDAGRVEHVKFAAESHPLQPPGDAWLGRAGHHSAPQQPVDKRTLANVGEACDRGQNR